MTSVRVEPVYEEDKTYPILVKMSGGSYQIKEMLGSVVNRHNGIAPPRKNYDDEKMYDVEIEYQGKLSTHAFHGSRINEAGGLEEFKKEFMMSMWLLENLHKEKDLFNLIKHGAVYGIDAWGDIHNYVFRCIRKWDTL